MNSAANNQLNALITKLGNPHELLKEISAELLRSTNARFKTQTDIDGAAWQANDPIVIKRKRHAIVLTGTRGNPPPITSKWMLRNSIRSSVLSKFSLVIGSTMDYAKVHNEGGRSYWKQYKEWWNNPRRSFIGIGKEDAPAILTMIDRFLK